MGSDVSMNYCNESKQKVMHRKKKQEMKTLMFWLQRVAIRGIKYNNFHYND